MSDKQYPTDPAGQEDKGSDRATRFRPCTKLTWCIRGEGHLDECEIRNRPPAK